MDRDGFMRRVLLLSAGLNAGAAALFAFPSSAAGQLAGLPAPGQPVYRALLAFFVLLFGGVYLWLARRPVIDRSFVAFAAIGKTGVVVIVVGAWLLGGTTGRSVLTASTDLVLAGIFVWWLVGARSALRGGRS